MVLKIHRTCPWLQLIQAISVAVIAVTLVKVELRQHHNDRIRTLCAAYWGAPDASPAEKHAWDQTKRLVGLASLDMLSFCRFYGDQ
jgi:hypothetical protein